jgi:hypothetical protein
MNELIDPRWKELKNRSWTCASCGESHTGLLDLGCDRPDVWTGSDKALPNSAWDATHCLTEDFCILEGEHYFVRCILHLPLVGDPGEHFGFGVWSSLSRTNFETYRRTFNGGEQSKLGPWFGWFSNRLKGYPDTLNLKCRVHPQDGRQRPYIELEPTEHPLARESVDGISFERLFEIYAAYGHPAADRAP